MKKTRKTSKRVALTNKIREQRIFTVIGCYAGIDSLIKRRRCGSTVDDDFKLHP